MSPASRTPRSARRTRRGRGVRLMLDDLAGTGPPSAGSGVTSAISSSGTPDASSAAPFCCCSRVSRRSWRPRRWRTRHVAEPVIVMVPADEQNPRPPERQSGWRSSASSFELGTVDPWHDHYDLHVHHGLVQTHSLAALNSALGYLRSMRRSFHETSPPCRSKFMSMRSTDRSKVDPRAEPGACSRPRREPRCSSGPS